MSLSNPFQIPCHLAWTAPNDYTVFKYYIYLNNQKWITVDGPATSTTIHVPSGTDCHIEVVTTDFTHFGGPIQHTSPSAGIDIKSP